MKIRRNRLASQLTALLLAGGLAASALITGPATADAHPWQHTSLAPATRAEMIVEAVTLTEKSAQLYGYGSRIVDRQVWQAYVKGNARLVKDQWELVEYIDPDGGQLSNLSNDPGQADNRWNQPLLAGVRTDLVAAISRWRASCQIKAAARSETSR